MYLKKCYLHFKKVCTHKFWVFHYCCKAGIPVRGLLHDLSKFSPTEFFESVKYYQGTRSPIDACKEDIGYSNAWFHHKGRNKHHYEYWFDNIDKGGVPVKMPYKYALEMLCDYLGAGRAYMGKDFSYEKELEWWYNKLKQPIAMHEETKAFIGCSVAVLASSTSSKATDELNPFKKGNKCKARYESGGYPHEYGQGN